MSSLICDRWLIIIIIIIRRSKSMIKPNFSTYLNSRMSYNYFRFGKTNVRHIGIVVPIFISIIS